MSIVVEHDKRRYEILEKALDVFVDEGFENATFQKIADKCGITRTTLYIYFKNKREIFNYSIKQFLRDVEDSIIAIGAEKSLSHTERLIKVMTVTIESLEENSRLLSVVLDYLVHLAKNNADRGPGYRVRRRTLRMKHIQATMIIAGIKAGEFSPSINVKDANELLYSLFEAAVFRLVILRCPTVESLKAAMRLAVCNMTVTAEAAQKSAAKR